MEVIDEYKLLVFDSTHHALQAEDVLKGEGYRVMMVPVPPEISADCGIAIRFKADILDFKLLLDKANIELAGYYQVIKKDLEKRIIRLELKEGVVKDEGETGVFKKDSSS